MPRLIAALIRHGDYAQLQGVPSAHQPFPLTATGERQSRAAATAVLDMATANDWRIDPIVDCSEMLRGWQTARLIADGLAARLNASWQVESFGALAERGVGSVANLSVDQIEAVLQQDPRYPPAPPGWKSDSHYRLPFPDAESLMEAGERVAAHVRGRLAAIAEDIDADTLKLFVGHGAAFRHAAYVLGVIEYAHIARLSMFHAGPVYIESLADRAWAQVGGEWKLRPPGEPVRD